MSTLTVHSNAARRPPSDRRARQRMAVPTHTRVVGETAGVVLVAILLVVGLWLGGARGSASTGSALIRVDAGQTLWSIASQHPLTGLTTEQTAELIARANGLAGYRLVAGSTLRIPIQETAGDAPAIAMR
jgi:Tfp pilus assembly protein FimV